MPWIYATFAAAAVFSILAGAIGGGVWWAVTAIGLALIAAWFAVDRVVKRRSPDGQSHTTGAAS
jgi:hypothetical protein